MRALLFALVALGASCGGETCCAVGITVGEGKRYLATIPSLDGGTPTIVEFILETRPTSSSPGAARLTFTHEGREVVEAWTTSQHD